MGVIEDLSDETWEIKEKLNALLDYLGAEAVYVVKDEHGNYIKRHWEVKKLLPPPQSGEKEEK